MSGIAAHSPAIQPRPAPPAGPAVFRNISQALHVSYLMSVLPVTQKGSTQIVIEDLMRQAGITTDDLRDGTLNFSGLGQMDIRAQCAMVRGAVDHHCAEPERHAIWAWFAMDSSKAEGVRYLREYCRPQLTIESPSAQMLMVWAVHATGRNRERCNQRAIAAEHELSQSTVQRNMAKIAKQCGALRERGMVRLAAMFERDGLVESAAVATT